MKTTSISEQHFFEALKEYLYKYKKDNIGEIQTFDWDYKKKCYRIYHKELKDEKTNSQLNFRLNDDCTRSG